MNSRNADILKVNVDIMKYNHMLHVTHMLLQLSVQISTRFGLWYFRRTATANYPYIMGHIMTNSIRVWSISTPGFPTYIATIIDHVFWVLTAPIFGNTYDNDIPWWLCCVISLSKPSQMWHIAYTRNTGQWLFTTIFSPANIARYGF